MKDMDIFGKGILGGFKQTEFISQATKFPNRNLIWKLAEKFHEYNKERFPLIEDFVQALHDAEWKETVQEKVLYKGDKNCVVTLYTVYNFKSPKQYYEMGTVEDVHYVPHISTIRKEPDTQDGKPTSHPEMGLSAVCKPESVDLQEHICFTLIKTTDEISRTILGIAGCALAKDVIVSVDSRDAKGQLTHCMNKVYKGWK